MATIKWNVPTALQTVMTAGNLNSLASGSSFTSSAYNNTTGLDLVADLILAIQYNTGPPAAGTRVAEIYLMSSPDATNYPSTDGTIPQLILLIGTLESKAPSTSALEFLILSGISIPPLNFKLLLKNTSGVTLHASASMFLKMQPYQMQAV